MPIIPTAVCGNCKWFPKDANDVVEAMRIAHDKKQKKAKKKKLMEEPTFDCFHDPALAPRYRDQTCAYYVQRVR
jgi:hypothetical protein